MGVLKKLDSRLPLWGWSSLFQWCLKVLQPKSSYGQKCMKTRKSSEECSFNAWCHVTVHAVVALIGWCVLMHHMGYRGMIGSDTTGHALWAVSHFKMVDVFSVCARYATPLKFLGFLGLPLTLQLLPLYHTVTWLEEEIWFRNDGLGVIIAKDDYKRISKRATLKWVHSWLTWSQNYFDDASCDIDFKIVLF